MDSTLPSRSLDAQFDALWLRFHLLHSTTDTINSWSARLRRWIRPINISFIVPIEDEAVSHYLGTTQEILRPFMKYAPQPSDKLHITIYQVGYLRRGLALPGTWTRAELSKIASFASQNSAFMDPFEVIIGPMNAFPNVAIAEVHDNGNLRLLRAIVAKAVPPLMRELPAYPLIPHVTLGYFGHRPAAPIREALEPLRQMKPIRMRVDRVVMTMYYRKPGPHEPTQALQHSVEEVLYTIPIGADPS